MKQRGGLFGTRLSFFAGDRTKLFNLIDNGSAEDFQTSLTEVLQKYPIDQITNKSGTHLLTHACIKNRLDVVKILKANGADFSILDSDITRSQPQYMRDYFTDFTFVDTFVDSNNTSPLLAAIFNRNKELVQYLVENNVNILVKTTTNGSLSIALFVSDDTFDYLFEIYKKNVNQKCLKIYYLSV
jgi:ankyrin repeat protein